MKMGRFEKSLVNSRMRSRRVSRHAERMLELAEFREGQAYLDVGCGNGAAPLRISRQYGLDVTGVDVDAEQIHLAREAVQRWRGRGVNIAHIHRTRRTGFKAGALAAGMERAQGEFLALFDADFLPENASSGVVSSTGSHTPRSGHAVDGM